MESEKENYKRLYNRTRIPLPCKPLPPIPDHLLSLKDSVREIKRRAPLGDLNNKNGNFASCVNKPFKVPQNPAVSSSKKVLSSGNLSKLDTRFVTLRGKSEEQLDWNYRVFSDFFENKSIASISDDESYLNESATNNVDKLRRKSTSNETPRTHLQTKRIKNLKRSLKRPHSRELQGLSPANGRKKKDDRNEKLFLSCNNRHTREPTSFIQCTYMTALTKNYTDDIFAYLFEAELRSPRPEPRIASITRACVINWLIKVNGSGTGGNPAVIQAACWYFDSILMTHKVDMNNLQLVSAACYWIALKLNGPTLTAEQMALFASNAFTVEKLLYAEKSVIKKLKFPPLPVVPQEFIAYLALWCDSTNPGEIEAAATFLCLASIMVDKSLCAELPSVIAGASVRNALVLLKKENLLFQLSMCPVYMQITKRVIDRSMVDANTLDAILRKAVRTVSKTNYEYKALIKYFECAPFHVAEKIIEGSLKMAQTDAMYSRKSTQ